MAVFEARDHFQGRAVSVRDKAVLVMVAHEVESQAFVNSTCRGDAIGDHHVRLVISSQITVRSLQKQSLNQSASSS
jgi:hypothetical protein